MIDLLPLRSKGYAQNSDRVSGDKTPCAICGRGVDTSRPHTAWIHLHDGGCSIVTEREATDLNRAGHESADMYFYPVGPDCLKRHPELRPYVARTPDDEPDGLVSVPGFGTSRY